MKMKINISAVLLLLSLSLVLVSCDETKTSNSASTNFSDSFAEDKFFPGDSQQQQQINVSIEGYWWMDQLLDNQRWGICFKNGRFTQFSCNPIFGLREILFSVTGSYNKVGNTIQLKYDDGDTGTMEITVDHFSNVKIKDGHYTLTR